MRRSCLRQVAAAAGGAAQGREGEGGGVGKVLPRSAVKRQLNVVAILKRGNLGALGGRRGVGYECKGNIATVSTLRRIV